MSLHVLTGDRSADRSAVRVLLANNHCITDPTAGVTQSLRTIVEWLADAGHACHVLTTARFESRVTFSIEEHLGAMGVDRAQWKQPSGRARSGADRARRAVVNYRVKASPVTLLMTRHNDETRPDRREAAQFLSLADRLFDDSCPTS